ncbi:MAG: toprim domain-containing protein [Turicibacter sp.]
MEFSFEFEKPITKDFLLSKHTQEKYMEHYTGVPVKKGLFISPLRADSKPTCSFYKNKSGDLVLKDFNGSFCGNFISVVMEKFSCTYYKALQIIANDFGLIKRPDLKINPPKIEYSGLVMQESKTADVRIEMQEFTERELNWWLGFGITKETLKKFRVYSCKNVFLNGNFFSSSSETIPMFGYYGGKRDGLEMWRIYMPTKRNYRFLSNWNKNMIQGAHMLPETGELVVITKSMKDAMLLYEMGINAIAPNSESTFVNELQLAKLKSRFKHVVVLYDNDLPGITAMNKFRKLNDVKCIWLPRNSAKDISDFYKKYGKKRTKELIEYGKDKILYNREDKEKIRKLCA